MPELLDEISRDSAAGPRILAYSLAACVAQTFLGALGIDITFSREGRAGSRIIRMRATLENIVTPSAASVTSSLGQDDLRRHQPVMLRRRLSPDLVRPC